MHPDPHTPSGDTAAIHSRLERHPRMHRLAIRFVEEWPQRFADMRSAADRRDLPELARLAHGLKGVGGSVGYDALFEPAKALDLAAKAGDERLATHLLEQLGELGRRLKAPDPMPADAPPLRPLGAAA